MSFSPPEGIFAFATDGGPCGERADDGVSVPLRGFLLLLHSTSTDVGDWSWTGCFSPPEGIFAFATNRGSTAARDTLVKAGFSPPEGIFAFATRRCAWAWRRG